MIAVDEKLGINTLRERLLGEYLEHIGSCGCSLVGHSPHHIIRLRPCQTRIEDIGVENVGVKNIRVEDIRIEDVRVENIGIKYIRVKNVRIEDVGIKYIRVEDVRVENIGIKYIRVNDIRIKNIRIEDIRIENIGVENVGVQFFPVTPAFIPIDDSAEFNFGIKRLLCFSRITGNTQLNKTR